MNFQNGFGFVGFERGLYAAGIDDEQRCVEVRGAIGRTAEAPPQDDGDRLAAQVQEAFENGWLPGSGNQCGAVDDLADVADWHAAGLIADAQQQKFSGCETQAILIMGEGIAVVQGGGVSPNIRPC